MDFTRVSWQKLSVMVLPLLAAIYTTPSYSADSVVLTFSTVGDSRQDPIAPDSTAIKPDMKSIGNCQIPSGEGLTPNPGLSGQDCKWLQNSAAWSLIMRTIQSQKANILFFNGDMIMGYGKNGVPVARTKDGTGETPIATPSITDVLNSDVMQSYKQYAFWRGMVANLMETGTYVVPVPGNHEVQCKRCGKKAQVENENAWRDNMGDLILDTARFNSPLGKPLNFDPKNYPSVSPNGITTDQSQLSFSFDVGTNHFVVINTDAVGFDGHAPTTWLDADLTAAENKGAKHIFIFGHKPAFYYEFTGFSKSATNSLNDTDPAAAKDFWNVVNAHKATYFCGHEHEYNVSQPLNLKSYQVLVGTGGSPFDAAVPVAPATLTTPSDRMYSWATVQIYKSGKVIMTTYGFDDTLTKSVVKLATITLATK